MTSTSHSSSTFSRVHGAPFTKSSDVFTILYATVSKPVSLSLLKDSCKNKKEYKKYNKIKVQIVTANGCVALTCILLHCIVLLILYVYFVYSNNIWFICSESAKSALLEISHRIQNK